MRTFTCGVSAGKRDQIEIFFKKKFLSKMDVDLIISKKNFLSIWSFFLALTLYDQPVLHFKKQTKDNLAMT